MSSTNINRKAAPIMRAATHTLALYALIVVIVEAGFGVAIFSLSGPAQTATIIGMISILILVVGIAGWRWTAPKEALPPGIMPIDPLWGEEHLPLEPVHVTTWEGTWRCQWSARNSSGKQVPYVDDTVKVESVDPETGELNATTSSVYEKNPTGYTIKGRISKQGLAHLYYQFPPPHEEKVGMVILRIDCQKETAQGWWLGGGRGHGSPDVGGLVTWTKAESFKGEWVDRLYEFE